MSLAVVDTHDGFTFTGLAHSTSTSGYVLLGGRYAYGVSASFSSSVATIDALMPDGSTWLVVLSLSASGGGVIYLAPGTYRFTFDSTTDTGQGFLLHAQERRG